MEKRRNITSDRACGLEKLCNYFQFVSLNIMPTLFFRAMVSWKGIYFALALFLGSFFGSIFMLGPFLPLMFISPAWYRWITDRIVATWLTLPVVSGT